MGVGLVVLCEYYIATGSIVAAIVWWLY